MDTDVAALLERADVLMGEHDELVTQLRARLKAADPGDDEARLDDHIRLGERSRQWRSTSANTSAPSRPARPSSPSNRHVVPRTMRAADRTLRVRKRTLCAPRFQFETAHGARLKKRTLCAVRELQTALS